MSPAERFGATAKKAMQKAYDALVTAETRMSLNDKEGFWSFFRLADFYAKQGARLQRAVERGDWIEADRLTREIEEAA